MRVTKRLQGCVAAAALVVSMGAGIAFGSPAASASGDGSIILQVADPHGALVDGYCLSAANGAGSFITAGSGTDGNTGEINQANVPAGSYKAVIYDCGGGQGYVSSSQLTFGVTANTQTDIGEVDLTQGGSIFGQVLDDATGAGAPDVSVTAWDPTKAILMASACTDSGGNYSFGGLPVSGVKVDFVTGGCSNDASYVSQWYDGSSGYVHATVIDPTPACCGTMASTVTLADNTSSKSGKVTITSVAFSGSSSAPVFTVDGTGFGAIPGQPVKPGCPEIAGAGKNYGSTFYFNDNSANQWQAGTGGDCIGLIIRSWTATSVVFSLGSWYSWSGGGAGQGTILANGDPYTMTLKGAHFTGSVNIT